MKPLQRNILLFTGAGIGNPLGLPTTSGFNETLDSLDPNIVEALNYFFKGDKRSKDVEHVLSTLVEFSKRNSFIDSVISRNSHSGAFNNVNNVITDLEHRAKAGIRTIQADIFDYLQKFDLEASNKLYKNIIAELQMYYDACAVSIFTTNYDLTFEESLADNEFALSDLKIKTIEYGFAPYKNGKSSYDSSRKFDWDRNTIEYKKLHGSLDWTYLNNKCYKLGVGVSPRDPHRMPLLFPGFKGIPTSEPFLDLHDQLSKRLGESHTVYTIGFAFRDEYINSIFDFSLKRNTDLEIYCFNPSDIEDLPLDSRIKYFLSQYPKRFHYPKRGVSVEDNPLKLNDLKPSV